MRRPLSLFNQAKIIPKITTLLKSCYSFVFKGHKFTSFAIITLLITALSFSTISQPVGALLDSKYPIASRSLAERAKSTMLIYAVSRCIKNDGRLSGGVAGNLISEENARSGDWFNIHNTENKDRTDPSFFVTTNYSQDGRINCTDAVKAGISTWGYSDGLELLCEFVNERGNGSSCKTGSGGFGSTTGLGFSQNRPFNSNDYTKFQAAVTKKLYTAPGSQSDTAGYEAAMENGAGWYLVYNAAFRTGCSAVPSDNPGADFRYEVTAVNTESKTKGTVVYEGKKRDTQVYVYTNKSLSEVKLSCGVVAERLSAYATDYLSYITAEGVTDTDTGTGGADRCSPGTSGCDQDTSSSCQIEGVGWIVCPVVNFMAGITDGAFGVITYFLQIRTALLDTNNGTFTAWQAFRNIANVAFVIVFLIIIFSQLTGVGVSNYGVKKTLPRLVIAAILVNLSFFVCQIAVDITQILGASIKDFLLSINVSPAQGTTPPPSSWVEVVGDVLSGAGILAVAGVAAAGITATVALSVSSAVLLAALLAVLMVVVILIGRQAAIVVLIVLSPLAFVAFLLPNTEQWFKKWYKMFIGLLMVYPIIALLYGGGGLAAKILSNIATDSTGADRLWLGIIALGVSAIPLIMTPALLKGALNATGSIGAKLSGMANKVTGRVGKTALTESRLGEARQGLKNRFALNRAEKRGNSRLQKAVDNSRIGRTLGLDRGSGRALQAVDEAEEKEVAAEMSKILHETNSVNRLDKAAETLQIAIKQGDVAKARAAQKVLLSGGAAGITKLQKALGDPTTSDNLARNEKVSGYLRSDINAAGLKGKNNVLATWAYSGEPGGLKIEGADGENSFLRNADVFKKLNSVELAGQSIDNLKIAARQGHISREAASAALTNSAAASLLDDNKRQLLADIAAGVGSTPSTPVNNPAPAARPDIRQPEAQAPADNLPENTSVSLRSQPNEQQQSSTQPTPPQAPPNLPGGGGPLPPTQP